VCVVWGMGFGICSKCVQCVFLCIVWFNVYTYQMCVAYVCERCGVVHAACLYMWYVYKVYGVGGVYVSGECGMYGVCHMLCVCVCVCLCVLCVCGIYVCSIFVCVCVCVCMCGMV